MNTAMLKKVTILLATLAITVVGVGAVAAQYDAPPAPGQTGERAEFLSEMTGLSLEELQEYFANGGTAEELAEEYGFDLPDRGRCNAEKVQAILDATGWTEEELREYKDNGGTIEDLEAEFGFEAPECRKRGHGHRGAFLMEVTGLDREALQEYFDNGGTIEDLAEEYGFEIPEGRPDGRRRGGNNGDVPPAPDTESAFQDGASA